MANSLTDAEKASIVTMYDDFDAIELDERLTFYDDQITTAMDAEIKAQVVNWDAIDEKFVSIEPNAANRGVRLDYGNRRSRIRDVIGKLLFMPSSMIGGGWLQRG